MNNKPFPIDAKTKVAELLEHYPEVEAVLLQQAPAFQRLKNPILRKTVARLTSLEAAARVAGINPRDLIIALRRSAGLEGSPDHGVFETSTMPSSNTPPDWFREEKVAGTVDADQLLAAGKAPLGEITDRLRGLEPGHILKMESSFEPAPLIDHLRGQDFRFWLRNNGANIYELFIRAL